MLKKYKIEEIDNIKINGRTTEKIDPLTLFWTSSGFEVNVKALELWVELEADYEEQEPWFSVLVNGVVVSRQMAMKGKTKVCLFRSRNPEEIKNVRFVKDSQAMHDDEKCFLQVHGLYTDGEFCPVMDRPHKLEFIGDSITSGEGLIGAREENDWVSMLFSGVETYAAVTADLVDADLRVCSQSGWGLFSSWDGCLENVLPAGYEKVCGVLTGDHNEKLGAHEPYQFSSWQPDAVIINLGTNDGAAFEMEGFNHDISEFEAAVVSFLKKVRSFNPEADIVWVYGMLGYSMSMPIVRAISSYEHETGDKKVHYLQLPNTTEETVGARQHPGRKSHRRAAELLADFLKSEILLTEE